MLGDAAEAVELSSDDELYSDSDDEAGPGKQYTMLHNLHIHTIRRETITDTDMASVVCKGPNCPTSRY